MTYAPERTMHNLRKVFSPRTSRWFPTDFRFSCLTGEAIVISKYRFHWPHLSRLHARGWSSACSQNLTRKGETRGRQLYGKPASFIATFLGLKTPYASGPQIDPRRLIRGEWRLRPDGMYKGVHRPRIVHINCRSIKPTFLITRVFFLSNDVH